MARGGGRGGRSKGPVPRDVLVSKKLSWLLRHSAEKEGLTLGKGGYINLAEVLANNNIKSLKTSLSEIQLIVADNAKQRFSLIHISDLDSTPPPSSSATTPPPSEPAAQPPLQPDTNPANYLIRANQGHSLVLADATGLLTPLTLAAGPAALPPVVVHGTRAEHWRKIVASGGLLPMGRNHVHFATGVPEGLRAGTATATATATAVNEAEEGAEGEGTAAVVSGMRGTSNVLVFLDLERALGEGLEFGVSQNGVVLTEGDKAKGGLVRLGLFRRVEERGGRVLVEDGVVVAEVAVKGKGAAREGGQ